MSGDVVARAKAALDATACPDEMQEFFRVGFVRELVAEVEKLRGALETIKAITTASELAHKIAVDLCGGTPSPFTVVGADILAVIERAGIEP